MTDTDKRCGTGHTGVPDPESLGPCPKCGLSGRARAANCLSGYDDFGNPEPSALDFRALEQERHRRDQGGRGMSDNTYDIKSIAVDLMRVADSLERHNQLQAAILAEMRAARALKLFEMVDAPIVDIHELDGAGRAADRLTAAALDEEDEG